MRLDSDGGVVNECSVCVLSVPVSVSVHVLSDFDDLLDDDTNDKKEDSDLSCSSIMALATGCLVSSSVIGCEFVYDVEFVLVFDVEFEVPLKFIG